MDKKHNSRVKERFAELDFFGTHVSLFFGKAIPMAGYSLNVQPVQMLY